jgi:hypothetical protein
MSRLDWFNTISERVTNGDEEHLDYVVVRHGVRIVTVFENEDHVDVSLIASNGQGFFRYAVVNATHRTMWVRFNTEATRKALVIEGAYTGTRTIQAYKKRKRRVAEVPYEAILSAQVKNPCVEPQETLITQLQVEDSEAKLEITRVLKHKEMENNVRINAAAANKGPVKSKGEARMPRDYLKAISKAVSKLAGPLGAPLEGLLSLYEDDKKDITNQRLEELLTSTQDTSREALNTVFEVRENLESTHKLLVDFLVPIVQSMRSLPGDGSNQAIEVIAHVKSITDAKQIKLATETSIIKELVQLFEHDIPLLIALLRDSGFPTEKIQTTGAPYTVVSNFVRCCRGENPEQLCRTFTELSNNKAGSVVLQEIARVSCEYSEWLKSK